MAVAHAGIRDEKRGIRDIDVALEVRIAGSADDMDVERHLTTDVAHDRGGPFDEAEADRAGGNRHVDWPLSRMVVKQACRDTPRRGQPDAGTLLEAEIDAERSIHIVHAPLE